ncbi:hypothetical protein P43SY_000351 [Pythium insidiosum]|uniref:DUF3730 domain-containing protein n=1 Tax=Pythium insidiosum TaxID=114742 RepID=A0AAD5Q4U3_PYTIN|nr:hypothetical protein P43SY_000351 [Pythium insidiosum]
MASMSDVVDTIAALEKAASAADKEKARSHALDILTKAELIAFKLLQQLVDESSGETLVETYADLVLQVSLANPSALSGFLGALEHPDFQAHLDTVLQSGPLEQSLLLRILSAVLPIAEQKTRAGRPRGVYVEILLVPLVAVSSSQPALVTPLLQWIMDVTASTEYAPADLVDLSIAPGAPDADAVHVWTFMELLARVDDLDDCVSWVNTLFTDGASISDPTWLAVQLGALLVDRRGSLRDAALQALDRQVQHHRHAWGPQPSTTVRLLVSTLVYLTSYRPAVALRDEDACWLSHGLQTLVRVAATTSETLKLALRLVRRLRGNASLRPQVLHLVFLMWTHDTRVYPQLESALLETEEESDDDELAVVRMATLLGLCERDPERGVEWVGAVQRGLEDPQAPVAAMAVRAVAALCAAEWLDIDTTVKILATKKKKGRLAAVGDARVQRELCRLYALAGPQASARSTARAVDELWTLAEAEDASVRCAAVQALVGLPLVSIGLEVSERGADEEEEDDDDDEEDEDEEANVREKVEHVWSLLETERDSAVRSALEALLARVVEAESRQLHSSSSSRNVESEWTLESRVSSAATKELRRALPTRERVLAALDAVSMDSWRRLLLAYAASDAVDASALKRKDKRLRVVQVQVDDMTATLDRVLTAIASAGSNATGWWIAAEDAPRDLLDFVDRLAELSELTTPSTAAASANSVHTIVDSLQQRAVSEPMAFVAVAALSHQLSARSVDDHGASSAVRRALRQSVDERRVFTASTGPREDAARRCLLVAALLLSASSSAAPSDADVALVRSLMDDESECALHRAVATLCLGQYGAAMARDSRSGLSSVKTVAETVWTGLLTSASLRSQPKTELFSLQTMELHKAVGAAAEFGVAAAPAASTTNPEARATLLWASCMALASLASQFPRRQRLDWLDNLRIALAEAQSLAPAHGLASVLAVALGPVLLSCAQLRLVSSDDVTGFVVDLTRRLKAQPARESSACAVASLVLPAMLSRMARLRGGYAVDVAAVVEPVVQQLGDVDAAFAQAAAANWFHCDIGVSTASAADDAQSRMLRSVPETSTAAAMLADRSESLVVVQKSKTFDAELSVALPNTTLLFKMLAFLRDAAQDRSVDRRTVRAMTLSLLRCLCRVPHVIPSIDLATLLARLARRFGADSEPKAPSESVVGATLSLASLHGSGVEYLRSHAFTATQLLNLAPEVLAQAIEALIQSADPANASTRRGRGKLISSSLLSALLGRHFDALVNRWSNARRPNLVAAWRAWIDGVAKLLQPPSADDASLDEASVSSLSALVLDRVLPGLPFSPCDEEVGDVRQLLKRFGADVLGRVALLNPEPAARIVTWLFVKSTEEKDEWWRQGTILAAFIDRLGVEGERLHAAPRLVFQWMLQQDFGAWTTAPAEICEELVLDLAAVVARSPTTKDPVGSHETWMLEALDSTHRDMTSQTTILDSPRMLKWRALFSLATNQHSLIVKEQL